MKKLLSMMLAGIVLFAACKGPDGAELAKMDTVSIPQDKLVKTAGINFKVKDVQQCSEKIDILAVQLGGTVMHHDITSNPGNTKDIKLNDDSIIRVTAYEAKAEMTVKIPSLYLSIFTDSVSRLGIYVNNSHLDIEDKSLDYLSADMKIANHTEALKQRKYELKQEAAKPEQIKPENVTALSPMKDSLVNEKISNLKIARDARYSTVNLSFYQSPTVLKEVLPSDNLSVYNLPFFKRLSAAFAFGWSLFTEALLFIANLWVLIIIGVAAFFVVRNIKKPKQST